MTLTDTIAALRSVPRSARVAQGFPRLRDFALHVMRVRAERARIHASPKNSLRVEITARLQRILDADLALRRAARQAADLPSRDSAPCTVVYAPRKQGASLRESRVQPAERGERYTKYHWRNCGASGTVYHPSTRHVSVPAAWLIARIRESSHV